MSVHVHLICSFNRTWQFLDSSPNRYFDNTIVLDVFFCSWWSFFCRETCFLLNPPVLCPDFPLLIMLKCFKHHQCLKLRFTHRSLFLRFDNLTSEQKLSRWLTVTSVTVLLKSILEINIRLKQQQAGPAQRIQYITETSVWETTDTCTSTGAQELIYTVEGGQTFGPQQTAVTEVSNLTSPVRAVACSVIVRKDRVRRISELHKHSGTSNLHPTISHHELLDYFMTCCPQSRRRK